MKLLIEYIDWGTKIDLLFPRLLDCPRSILRIAKRNEDGEISSRELTNWYVESFCDANHLKL